MQNKQQRFGYAHKKLLSLQICFLFLCCCAYFFTPHSFHLFQPCPFSVCLSAFLAISVTHTAISFALSVTLPLSLLVQWVCLPVLPQPHCSIPLQKQRQENVSNDNIKKQRHLSNTVNEKTLDISSGANIIINRHIDNEKAGKGKNRSNRYTTKAHILQKTFSSTELE